MLAEIKATDLQYVAYFHSIDNHNHNIYSQIVELLYSYCFALLPAVPGHSKYSPRTRWQNRPLTLLMVFMYNVHFSRVTQAA